MTSEVSDPYEWTGLKNEQGAIIDFDGLSTNEELKDILFSETLEVRHVMIKVNSYDTQPTAKVNWFILEEGDVIIKIYYVCQCEQLKIYCMICDNPNVVLILLG